MKVYLLLVSLLLLSAVNAQSYNEAKKGIKNGKHINSYKNLINHPLYPYLLADYYRNYLNSDDKLIPIFKKSHHIPPIKDLYNMWIENNFRRGNFTTIIDNYYDIGNQVTNCIYRQSQILTGNWQRSLKNIEQIWFSPKPISDYCNPVFFMWLGKKNPKNILKRAKMAYLAGNGKFAQYMANKLSNDKKLIILRFANFLRQPQEMLEYNKNELTRTALHRQLLPLALEKLIYKDSSAYTSFTVQFLPIFKDDKDYQNVLSKLVIYLSNRKDPQVKMVYDMLTSPNKSAKEALLRFFVGLRDWTSIKKYFSIDDNSLMIIYWLGRATESLGRDANKIYKKISDTRSYYGFLASDKLGKNYNFNNNLIIPDSHIQNGFEKNSGLVRGKLLYQMGENIFARKEILLAAKNMENTTKKQLAYWLNKQGFYYDAIHLLGKIRDWNDIRIRFPTPYNKYIENAKHITQISSSWIYAIIRKESSMNPDAVSLMKAKGLMQLIPSTAKQVARDLGINLSGDDIFNSRINIKLGTKYLSQMYQRFGNIILASAAYNAGPHRVEKWLANYMHDMTIWIESIPINETRKYVKRVVEYQQVYARHLGENIPTLTKIISQHSILPIMTLSKLNDD